MGQWNLVQTAKAGNTSSPTSPQTLAFTNPNQAGNLLVVQVQVFSSGSTPSPTITGVTDTQGNGPSGSYNLTPGAINHDSTNGIVSAVYYVWNCAAGANTVSVAFANGNASGISQTEIFISEWENSAGAVTVDPIDGASYGMQQFSSLAVPQQILVPITQSNDLILMMAWVNNVSDYSPGSIGGVSATALGATNSTLSQYVTSGVPFSSSGFAPGIAACVMPQPETAWTGVAIAFTFGGNGGSRLPILVDEVTSPIEVATSIALTMLDACTAGDLIIVAWNSSFALSSIHDSAGNTYQTAASSSPNGISYAYNIAPYAAGNVVTVTFAGSSSSYVGVFRYTNIVSTSNPLDQAAYTPATSGTNGQTPSVTTLFPNELVFAAWTTGAPMYPQFSATSWNSEWNVRDAASNSEQTEVDLVLGAPGPVQSTGTFQNGGSDAWGCGIVTFQSKALFISSQPSSQTVKVGQTATFSVTAVASAGSLSYQWQLNGSNISGATSSSYTTGTLGVGDSGAYTCIVTDSYGSTTSQQALLYVTANPGGGLGIPTIGQVSNGEIPSSSKAPADVIFFSMNF